MKRKILAIMLILSLCLAGTLSVYGEALTGPEEYRITVSNKGGTYSFDGISVHFKKDFLGKGMDPAAFDVRIYAEDGIPYIEFNPDVEDFDKKVMVKVDRGERSFYDITTGETITLLLDHNNFHTDHFSRLVVID